MKPYLVIQHVDFENCGSFSTWCQNRHFNYDMIFAYNLKSSPQVSQYLGILVMGGPMSVNDESGLPWIKTEKEIIRKAIVENIPLIGICLGAQMIANVLGATIEKNAVKEIGWFPTTFLPRQEIDQLNHFPRECMCFHWHGEYFHMPNTALPIAHTTGCRNQGFFLPPNTFGFQFHPEVSEDNIKCMVTHCQEEISDHHHFPFIQSGKEISALGTKYIASSVKLYHEFLDKWHRKNLENIK